MSQLSIKDNNTVSFYYLGGAHFIPKSPVFCLGNGFLSRHFYMFGCTEILGGYSSVPKFFGT